MQIPKVIVPHLGKAVQSCIVKADEVGAFWTVSFDGEIATIEVDGCTPIIVLERPEMGQQHGPMARLVWL
jgi:hypothetical protein